MRLFWLGVGFFGAFYLLAQDVCAQVDYRIAPSKGAVGIAYSGRGQELHWQHRFESTSQENSFELVVSIPNSRIWEIELKDWERPYVVDVANPPSFVHRLSGSLPLGSLDDVILFYLWSKRGRTFLVDAIAAQPQAKKTDKIALKRAWVPIERYKVSLVRSANSAVPQLNLFSWLADEFDGTVYYVSLVWSDEDGDGRWDHLHWQAKRSAESKLIEEEVYRGPVFVHQLIAKYAPLLPKFKHYVVGEQEVGSLSFSGAENGLTIAPFQDPILWMQMGAVIDALWQEPGVVLTDHLSSVDDLVARLLDWISNVAASRC